LFCRIVSIYQDNESKKILGITVPHGTYYIFEKLLDRANRPREIALVGRHFKISSLME
jgi:hypothetical protein